MVMETKKGDSKHEMPPDYALWIKPNLWARINTWGRSVASSWWKLFQMEFG